MKISVDTPVDDVIKQRPLLVSLAQKVFKAEEVKCLAAFNQFRKSKEIADLIEAKRAGVFDYGVCIIRADSGSYSWPKAAAALEALKKAEAEELTEDDMEDLGLDSDDLNKVLMKKGRKKPAAKKPAAKKETKTETPKEEKGKVIEMKGRKPKKDPEPKAEEEAPSEDFGAALADVLESQQSRTERALRGMIGYLEAIFCRQDVLAERQEFIVNNFMLYLDPNGPTELPELPGIDELAIQDIVETLGDNEATPPPKKTKKAPAKKAKKTKEPDPEPEEDNTQDEEDALLQELGYTKRQISKMNDDARAFILTDHIPADDVSILNNGDVQVIERDEEGGEDGEEPEEGQEASEGDNGAGDEYVTYTKDQLEDIKNSEDGLQALREIADSLGVPRALKLPFKDVLIDKILERQE